MQRPDNKPKRDHEPFGKTEWATIEREFAFTELDIFLRFQKAKSDGSVLSFSEDDPHLQQPIHTAVSSLLPVSRDKAQKLSFTEQFLLAKEIARPRKISSTAGFHAEWRIGDWFHLVGRLPTLEEIYAYFGRQRESILFDSTFGGFNLAIFTLHKDGKTSTFITDLYWMQNNENGIVLESIFDNIPSISIAYRLPDQDTWQQGRVLPDALDITRLQNLDL